MIAAFTDSSDEKAAPSSLSDSTSQKNNDWLTDDDDDDDDENMDESPLNVQPAAKSAAKLQTKSSSAPLTVGKSLKKTHVSLVNIYIYYQNFLCYISFEFVLYSPL